MAKSRLKIEAREMRRKGLSIKNIARDLGVSTSTASLWCRDIKLTSHQIADLEKNSRDPYYGRRLAYSLKQQYLRKVNNEKIKNEAITSMGKLSERDQLIAGTALYWAEGFKKDKMVGFSNTDPNMVRFILRWLRVCMGVNKETVKVRIVINESHKYREKEIQEHWAGVTGIAVKDFYKPTYQRVIWKKMYEEPDKYFGVLRVRILKSTILLKRILGMIDGLSESL